MADTTATGAHRLHPRLRVVRNGDRFVNAVRADAAATVACRLPASGERAVPPAAALAATSPDDLDALRGVASAPKTRLPKRPKIDEQPEADESYVNVFIELLSDRPTNTGEPPEAARARLTKILAHALPKAGRAAIGGAVLEHRNFVAATVPVSLLPDLEHDPAVAFVHPAEPLKHETPPRRRAGEPAPRALGGAGTPDRGAGVLVGIIDVGGFDFAHPDFLDDDGGTRFIAIWDQGGTGRRPPTALGFDYGAEFTRADLDAAIRAARQPGVPPATLLERQSQTVPGSHGTHVASIAAGRHGVCPEADIAAVLIDVPLPDDPVARRRTTFSDTSRVIHAVRYLLAVAEREGRPLVINISLGTNGGSHDGSGGVSRWLDAYLSTPGRAICAAAGNAGQEKAEGDDDFGWVMGRIHAEGRVPARGLEVELEWTVMGDGIEDLSENELEIWYGAQDRFAVAVKPPGSADWIEVGPRAYVENHRLPSGTTVSIYNELYHPTNGSNYVALYLSPNLDPVNFRGIDAGVWRVRLRGDEVRDGRFHAWIERDDPRELQLGRRRLFRFPSFFSERSNTDSHSISSLACGHRVIAVSNLDEARQRIHLTSSQGPTRDGRSKPEIAAPGTDVVAANGFASPDDPWVAMTGTSMASPYVAGVVGLMLGANPGLTAAQCAGILLRTARPLPGASYAWGNDVGYGRIDPRAAVDEARHANDRTKVRPRGRR